MMIARIFLLERNLIIQHAVSRERAVPGDGWLNATNILPWRAVTSACPGIRVRVGLESTPGDHLVSCPNAFRM